MKKLETKKPLFRLKASSSSFLPIFDFLLLSKNRQNKKPEKRLGRAIRTSDFLSLSTERVGLRL